MKRFVWIISLLFMFLFSFILTVSAQEWPGDLPEQAKKEGVVSWYTTAPVPEAKELADIFEKRYPFIKVEIFRSGGGAIANRVLAEHNAGSYMVDIIHGIASRGAIPPFRKKGIIMKYKFPEWKFVPGDLKDKEGYWTTFYQADYPANYEKICLDNQPVICVAVQFYFHRECTGVAGRST